MDSPSANPLRSGFARAALCLAVTMLGASPSPAPSAAPSAAVRTLSVVCERTPLWLFNPGNDRPSRAAEPQATLGQRFALVSGPRTTLSGFTFYETDVVVVEPGFPPGTHYWLSQACAIPSR
ncbi:MAG: hypothetical protein QOI11_3357 [Candidatus Eremiobacteraeota bacterium]|jgi:hypothetical protein|nr:hypothetical protein [Candidatus Eremiobacteraeota bacterium]